MAEPSKRGRKAGGHNAKPRIDKGRKTPKLGHGSHKPHPNSLRNLLAPWKPGQSGNPLGPRKRGSQVEVRKVFNELLNADLNKMGVTEIELIYLKFRDLFFRKNSVLAGRCLMDWGIGSPAQTVKIMPEVNIQIGVAIEVEQPNMIEAENVVVIRGEETKKIGHGGNGDGNNGDGSSGTPQA